MNRLQLLLDDVLGGRLKIKNPTTFSLLRRFSPGHTAEFDRLEAESVGEREEQAQRNNQTKSEPIRLIRNDLEDILRHNRPVSLQEIEWLLAHASDHDIQLSTVEELELRNIAARKLADTQVGSSRRAIGDEFILRHLGIWRTRYGDLSAWEIHLLESLRHHAMRAIQACADHKVERCECWSAVRNQLWEIRRRAGDKSPIGAAALAVWNHIENFARYRDRYRQEQADGEPEPGRPTTPYNWRYWRTT